MNYSALAFLTDEVIAVSVVFKPSKTVVAEGRNKSRHEFTEQKEYVYKTTMKDLQIGDVVLAQVAHSTAEFGLAVVEVTGIDVDVDFNAGTTYKWLVQKVDTTAVAALRDQESHLVSKVKGVEKTSKKQQLINAMGLAGMGDTLKLSHYAADGFEGQEASKL